MQSWVSVREPASKLKEQKLINRLKYSDKICQKCRIQEMEVVTTIEIKGWVYLTKLWIDFVCRRQIIEKKYTLRSITKKDLKVPEKPKLKGLGFTYNGAKLFNMLPIQMKKIETLSTFKTMTKDWIWENIPSY